MYTIPPKKMVTINILNILKKYSDIEHRMTQQDIAEKLKSDYSMEVDRKTIKRNLMDLIDIDPRIDYTEISRKDDKGNETTICTDWYIEPDFTDSELRLLVDSLLFSRNIPSKQCKELIDKLVSLSNIHFKAKVKHICNLPDNQPRNKELFYTIDVLDEAISQNKKVAFIYNSYGPDKQLHPKREAEFIINPYQMVATNGRYYLICNYDKYDTLANYRVDRITNIRILDEERKPISKLADGELNLPKHMAEHVYMFAGESIRAKFKAKNYLIDQIVDWFGTEVNIKPIDEKDEECMIEVVVNKEAFFCWAMQYSIHIEVMEPVDMRERISKAVRELNEKYNG